MSEWEKYNLSELADVKLSNVDKKTYPDHKEIRLCNYTDVYKNAFINSDTAINFMIATCSEIEYQRFKLRKGQVAITKDSEKRNDIGISTFISEDFEDIVLGYHLSLITPHEGKLDGKFLNYWFNSKLAKTYFENNAGGSGQRCTLPIDIIKSIPLFIPQFSTQKQISKTLFDLDAKIELNNRINAELEAMAKTLYDYWFVQFDFPFNFAQGKPDKNGCCTEPAEVKPYKTSGGKMVWNEELKREIPEGWENGYLNSIGDIIGGSTPSKAIDENFCQGTGMPWITPKDLSMNKGKKYITRGEWDVSEKGLKEASLKIMPAGTVLLSSRAPIGYLAIARTNVTTNQGFKSFVPKGNFSTEFIYYTVMNLIPEIEANSSGSTFQEVSTSTLRTIKTVIPTIEILSLFDEKIKPIFSQQDVLEEQNQKLAELRDWLLPMLMNGQVKIN